MRIVCTVTNDLVQDQRMDRICRSLAGAGHEVTLVGRLLPKSKPLTDRPYATHRIACRYHVGKAFYLEYNFRLWRTLRRWDFDAVCAVDLDTLVAGWLLKKRGVRLVYDAHEWFSETPEVIGRPVTRWVWRTVGRWLVPLTDARYTVAEVLGQKLSEEYGVAFGVVRNLPVGESLRDRAGDWNTKSHGGSTKSPGVAVVGGTEGEGAAFVQNQTKQRLKTLLYQGMLNPGRGLQEAIRALALLPDCQLLIVGSGPLEGALRRCEGEVGVRGRVVWAGFRPPAELPRITRNAWLGLNLLDDLSPSYYYSLANKALDYVQAGLPSVQMDFPEYRAINEKYGCYQLVNELTPESIATAVQRLLDGPARYAELRAGCARAAAQLRWEREERVLLRIWEQL